MTCSRREFLHTALGGGLALGLAQLPGCGGDPATPPGEPPNTPPGTPPAMPPTGQPNFRLPADLQGSELRAVRAMHDLGGGKTTPVWTFGGTYPGPTIRVRKGDSLSVQLVNQLAEDTNVHWHGLLTPASMDGHPRDVAAAGASRMYRFPVQQRAGTYWYHPHPDKATAKQAYLGMAGFFLVEDPEEQALGLPTGEFDVPILLQDRRLGGGTLSYAPTEMDIMDGYLGESILVNGLPGAALEVAPALYRLRLLNGSNARIFKLALEDGRPFQLIATDGGLLDAPVQAKWLWLGPGERVEVLVDFSKDAAGTTLLLRSQKFSASPGHGGNGGSVPPQGTAMDLMRFDVKRPAPAKPGQVPARLVPIEKLDPAGAKRTRTFELAMRMSAEGMHTINGKVFEMDRIDEKVAAGDTEIWEFRSVDPSAIHPIHIHGAQMQIVSRSGGTLYYTDRGWKDTVLVFPNETVRTLIRFGQERGVFLLHCHTLEHEDDGMMLNYEVGAPTS